MYYYKMRAWHSVSTIMIVIMIMLVSMIDQKSSCTERKKVDRSKQDL